MGVYIFDQEHVAEKLFVQGTHRTKSPSDTLALYLPLTSAMGITRLANITGLDVIGVPVFLGIRPNSRSLSTSQGKGLDVPSAKASAMMEAIELWHAEHMENPLRHDSYASLRGRARAVDIRKLPGRRGMVLGSHVPLTWVEGYDLLAGAPAWVPYEAVHTNFTETPGTTPSFVRSANGLASGNCLLEAIVHAICELIERDALTLARLAPAAERSATRLDLSTVDDARCLSVIDRVRQAGAEVVVYDSTSDLGVPTYECILIDHWKQPRWSLKCPCAGSGAHLAKEVALLRALTEAIQSRLTMIAGSRDDMLMVDYESFTDPDVFQAVSERLLREPLRRRFDEQVSLAMPTFEGDLAYLLDILRRAGVESAVAVDLTQPRFGVPVVRVVIPGLEDLNDTPGYSPGPRGLARRGEGAALSC